MIKNIKCKITNIENRNYCKNNNSVDFDFVEMIEKNNDILKLYIACNSNIIEFNSNDIIEIINNNKKYSFIINDLNIKEDGLEMRVKILDEVIPKKMYNGIVRKGFNDFGFNNLGFNNNHDQTIKEKENTFSVIGTVRKGSK